MGTICLGVNEKIPLGLEGMIWSSVYLYKRYPRQREKNREEKGGVQGALRQRGGGCGGVTLLFPSFRQTAKWGTTHMFVSLPSTSSGVSSTTQRHRGHHICKDPCLNPFFPLGGIQARAKPFPTPPLLDPTSFSPHRKVPGRIAVKNLPGGEKEQLALKAHLSRTQVLTFLSSSQTQRRCKIHPETTTARRDSHRQRPTHSRRPRSHPAPLPSHPPPAEHLLLSTSPPVGQSLHIPRSYRCGNGGTRSHC